MSNRKFSNGAATVTLDFDTSAAVAAAVNTISGGVLDALEGLAREVKAEAERMWYRAGEGGVTRRTGETGNLEVRTEIRSDSVRVGIWPMKKEAFYVHRPGHLSLTPRFASREEWAAAKKAGLSTAREKAGLKRWIVYEVNPKRDDGKMLLTELVRKPFRAGLAGLPEAVRARILRSPRGSRKGAPRKAR